MKSLIVGVTLFFAAFNLSSGQIEPFKTEKISENIYSFVSLNPLKDYVNGNVTAVIGTKGILVIDAGGDGAMAKAMIDELRKISNKPVKYLVNTHWHADHVMGNKYFKKAFPDVTIISHTATKQGMISSLPYYLGKPKESYAYYSRLVKDKKYKDGTPLVPLELTRYSMNVTSLERILGSLEDYEPLLPEVTFSDSLTIDLGNETVKLFSRGWVHSAGDVMAVIPSANIFVAGDIVVSPIPYAYDASLVNWITVLDEILTLKPTVIVPGHGETEHNLEYIKSLRVLLTTFQGEVKTAIAAGLSADDAVKRIRLEAQRKNFTGADALREAAFDIAFLEPAIRKEYAGLKK